MSYEEHIYGGSEKGYNTTGKSCLLSLLALPIGIVFCCTEIKA